MEVADHRLAIHHVFPVERHHEPQHPVHRGVVRPEVHHHRLRARFQLRHGAEGGWARWRDLRKEGPLLLALRLSDSRDSATFDHVPVLAGPVRAGFAELEGLLDQRGEGVLIDCTLGGGGHSALLLEAHPRLRLIGLDQDPTARAAAAERLAPFGDRVQIVATNFAVYSPAEPVVAVLADLGVSSPQLDVAERGFSFRHDGPLDMRMNPRPVRPRPS